MRKTSIVTPRPSIGRHDSCSQRVYPAEATIDGDTICGKKHMLPGKADAQCIHACLKGKASYALVVGANVYTLVGKPRIIAPFACKRVKVEGSFQGQTLTVISIHEMRQDMPHDTRM